MIQSNPTVEYKGSGFAAPISGFTAFLLGIQCICLSSTIPYSWVTSNWPGSSIPWILTLAAIFCLLHAISYSIIGSTCPREGADYYLSCRVVSPYIAFISSWTFVIASGLVAGGLAAWIPTTVIPSLLRPMAIVFNDPRYGELADIFSSSIGILITGLIILILSAVTTVRNTSVLQSMLIIGLICSVVAWTIIILSFLGVDNSSSFQTAWDRFMSSTSNYGSFENRIGLAKAAGMQVSNDTATMTFAGLIMGFWIYYGYAIPTYSSEGMQKPDRNLLRASIGALFVSWFIFWLGAVLLQRIVSPEWLAAEGYIQNNPSAVRNVSGGSTITSMPWITFYAAIARPSALLIIVTAICWTFPLLNLVQTYFFYTRSIVFRWASDSLLPRWANPRGPNDYILPSIVTFGLALIGLVDAAYGGPMGTQLKFAFFAIVTGTIPLISLMIIPWRRPKLLETMPVIYQRRVIGFPLSSWIAAATLSYFVWMIFASLIFTASGIEDPTATLTLLFFIATLGAGYIFCLRRYRIYKDNSDVFANYKKDVEFRSDTKEISSV